MSYIARILSCYYMRVKTERREAVIHRLSLCITAGSSAAASACSPAVLPVCRAV